MNDPDDPRGAIVARVLRHHLALAIPRRAKAAGDDPGRPIGLLRAREHLHLAPLWTAADDLAVEVRVVPFVQTEWSPAPVRI